MKLKDYQIRCLDEIKGYIQQLDIYKKKYNELCTIDPELKDTFNFPELAWKKSKIKNMAGVEVPYITKKNGLDEFVPNFCIKVPTGGGKTLLATRTIDLINTFYLHKKTGLVLWIVPSNQIYKQTLNALRNREHPYRQVLDLSSSGRTLILEKMDTFNLEDINNNLSIMLLMLPSANRQNKESLKIFKDRGGFESFFPPEDNYHLQEELLKKCPNLDYFGDENSFLGRQMKTSLGNTLRIKKPIVIIDEGQKAYSPGAQQTIRGFNPNIIVELSATPPRDSNPIVHISGQELNREDMIKLDIHVTNKSTTDWRDVILSSVQQRDNLENISKLYESKTGVYIRPISLIQVERTGKEQLGNGFIHSEEVKEHLIKHCGISREQIAIKSSEKDDIEGIDLLSKDCDIRYIITKQALQEGWDCPFAYVLTILTNTNAEMNITQLVGRILRQPYAQKTGIAQLDESYVYCFRDKTNEILEQIKIGLEKEGLGDIAGRVSTDANSDDVNTNNVKIIGYRNNFKLLENKIILPRFLVKTENSWRELSYEMDILSKIDWTKISYEHVNNLNLSNNTSKDILVDIGLSDKQNDLINSTTHILQSSSNQLNIVLVVRQLISIIPNPWIAFSIIEKSIQLLNAKYADDIIHGNTIFIIEELKKMALTQRDLLAENLFLDMVDRKEICFIIETNEHFALPHKNVIKSNSKILVRDTNESIEKSLYEQVPIDDLNNLEQSVAVYLDKQDELLWWYRNRTKKDYYIQGWKKYKIYPDFIMSKICTDGESHLKAYALETKGLHLDNQDTRYKNKVFELCNEFSKDLIWLDNKTIRGKGIEYLVLFEPEWKNKLNKIFK